MDLRDYQREAVEACFEFLRRGNRAPLIEVPTGGGKSAILGEICRVVVEEMGARVLVATHRKELISQDEKAILRVWPDGKDRVGVYSAGLGRQEVRDVTVAGVQSVCRKSGALGHVDVMIIDEAHLVSPKGDTQYGKLIKGLKVKNPDLVIVGLTATPYRLGQGLLTQGPDKIFEAIAYKTDIKRLIADGYLSPLFSSKVSTKIETEGLRISGGDFLLADLELACDVDSITESVARDIEETKRKHILVFGVSVAHASRLRNAIRMLGISCETVVGDTPNRAQILDDFKAGKIQCITSCDVLTTGFDAPNVDCLAIARPTQSPSLYVQICGRGMRIADGKTDCLVLDYGGNIARHGPIDEVKVKPKGGGDGNGKAPFKVCPECQGENHATARRCEFCDFEFPPPERKANERASKLDVISKEKVEPMRYVVEETTIAEHVSKQSGMRMLRVSYYGPASRSSWDALASEFVCLEHTGFARTKAEQWWALHADRAMDCPADVDEALTLTDYLRKVSAIHVVPDGKYKRVVACEFERMREPGEDDDDEENETDQTEETQENDFWDDEIPW